MRLRREGSRFIFACFAPMKVLTQLFFMEWKYLAEWKSYWNKKVCLKRKLTRKRLEEFSQNLVFLFHIFLFFTFQTFLFDRDYWVLMKLGIFVVKGTKISKTSMKLKSHQLWVFYAKMTFSLNHAATDFFFINEARKLRFGK